MTANVWLEWGRLRRRNHQLSAALLALAMNTTLAATLLITQQRYVEAALLSAVVVGLVLVREAVVER